MIYLDYSATTPVNKEVLKSFDDACINYIGNPNSKHRLGLISNEILQKSTENILKTLNVTDKDIIYTSGSSESNNLAIKGIADMYSNYGNHIITTELEHSSVISPCNFLQKKGFKVDFVKLNENGTIDLNNLEELLTEDTILVSIHSVNSEVGIIQQINKIKKIIKKHEHTFFHVDMTQSIGKINIDLNNIDLVSFSAHKFYGLKGIGALLINKKIKLTPLIHGGKSLSIFRSGTPPLPLIISFEKALLNCINNLDKNYKIVKELKDYLIINLKDINNVIINSTDDGIPHIVNISILNKDQDYILKYLSDNDIFVSTLSACSSEKKLNGSVYKITKDEKRALSSIRISLSYLTTKEELIKLIECIRELAYESN